MLLVHKPMPALSFAHRRLPSAPPTIAVRPTTTPGLLSIKPIHNKPATSPKLPRKRSHQPRESTTVSQSPSLERRGRKDAAAVRKQPPSHRSSSQHATIRNHHHQPSPPPLEKESTTMRNPDSDSEPSLTTKSTPTLIAQPSGRIARSRRKSNKKDQDEAFMTTAAVPVPIPRRRMPSTPTRPQSQPLSRSAPMSTAIQRPHHRRSETAIESEVLPIADWDASPPSTPKRQHDSAWQRRIFDNGPRTAPLSSASSLPFVFPSMTSTPPRHRRAPSYGNVFPFPFDEDQSGADSDHSVELKSLLASMQLGQNTPSLTQLDRFAYANSSFQNSPNPNELPPPCSFAGVQA